LALFILVINLKLIKNFLIILKLVLDIVESNPFKYLCHLSLHINAGTDGDVKKYLCDVTTSLKKDYQLLNDKYNHLVSTMEAESVRGKEQMETRNEEINQLRDQLHTQANSLSTKHFQDMTQEKEKLLKLQGELATKFEQERSDLERRHATVIIILHYHLYNRIISSCSSFLILDNVKSRG
jgi:spindle assembly abnormal protein 6